VLAVGKGKHKSFIHGGGFVGSAGGRSTETVARTGKKGREGG